MNTENQEQSDSEEEVMVYAEFDESVNIDNYRSIHVLGINDREPVIQADDTFFKGKFVNPLGTYMFFTEDPLAKSVDPLFDRLPEKNLKYLLKTNKTLAMEHAYVVRRDGAEQIKKDETEVPEDIPTVKFASVEEALKSFNSILNPNSDMCKEITPEMTVEPPHEQEMQIETENVVQT